MNPQSRTIQDRPDRRGELSTRIPEPVNLRPRRHLFGHRRARPTRTRTGLSCTSSEERSPDTCIIHPHSQSRRAFHVQRLFDPSDADQDGILHITIGVIPCGACIARSVKFRHSTFPASTSHGGGDEHSIPSLLPVAFELDGTSLCTCTQLLSNTSNLGGDGNLHKGAHSVSQLGAFYMRPLQLQCSCNPGSRTTSEEQTFNMLSIYSRCQLRRLGQVRTIQVGRFIRQT